MTRGGYLQTHSKEPVEQFHTYRLRSIRQSTICISIWCRGAQQPHQHHPQKWCLDETHMGFSWSINHPSGVVLALVSGFESRADEPACAAGEGPGYRDLTNLMGGGSARKVSWTG